MNIELKMNEEYNILKGKSMPLSGGLACVIFFPLLFFGVPLFFALIPFALTCIIIEFLFKMICCPPRKINEKDFPIKE